MPLAAKLHFLWECSSRGSSLHPLLLLWCYRHFSCRFHHLHHSVSDDVSHSSSLTPHPLQQSQAVHWGTRGCAGPLLGSNLCGESTNRKRQKATHHHSDGDVSLPHCDRASLTDDRLSSLCNASRSDCLCVECTLLQRDYGRRTTNLDR